MFSWLVALFMIASIVVLFAAWTRAIRIKDKITAPDATKRWATLRLFVFLALCAEVVLLVIALLNLQWLFGLLAGGYLVFFSVVVFYLVTYFMHGISSSGKSK